MGLDLSVLSKISRNSPMDWESEIGDPEPPERYRDTTEPQKPANRLCGALGSLQREADQSQTEREKSRQVYAEYQKNKFTVRTLKTELLRGSRDGEDITSLYLKAVKALSLTIGDEQLYRQIKADIQGRGV